MTAEPVRKYIDWTRITQLRLAARYVAEGVYVGSHRSTSRGGGVEFAGHRDYVPGDDLRFLDRRGLLRHGKLIIRQFETDTERPLHLLVDASPSMAFKSKLAPVSKFFYASVVAAALARLGVSAGDPVGITLFGSSEQLQPPRGGRQAFEHLVDLLEAVRFEPLHAEVATRRLEHALATLERQARRGAIIVLVSDLVDLPERFQQRFLTLATLRRTLIVSQVLDPVEATFPFDGAVRLRASEGKAEVETDGTLSRTGYLAELARVRSDWATRLGRHGGRLVHTSTNADPIEVVRTLSLLPRAGRS